MSDNIEFDITVDGKQAKRSLQDIDKEVTSLGKKSDDTTRSMKSNWMELGSAIKTAGIAVALQQAVASSLQLEKATFGLTRQTKDYIKVASEQYGLNQEIIAGFIQTGKSAGMSGDSIQDMIEQAVALSRAYPHESVETFVDNLSMLNTTGEAQGYIVDVLEQKWGAIDLKGKSLAEKMEAVKEATSGVNEEFEKTRASRIDGIFQEGKNAVSDFGDVLLDLADSSGIMSVFSKAVIATQYSLGGFKATVQGAKVWVKELFGADTTDDVKSFNAQLKENEEIWKKLVGVGKTAREKLSKPMLQDIKGSDKPREQVDIENTIKAEREKQKLQEKASKEEAKRIMKIAGLRDRFNSDYIGTVEGETALEMAELDKRYAEYDKHIEDKKKLNEWYSKSVEKIYEEEDEEAKRVAEEIKTVFQDAFKGAEDALVDFTMTGKTNLRDLFNSILEGVMRMQIRNSITQPLSQAIGSFFGAGATGATFHSGYIPSHHNGSMRSDERIAKLQVGESVISRHGTAKNRDALEAINRGESISGGGVVVNIENNSGTDITQDNVSTSQDGGTMVVNVVLDAIARNKGGMRDSIKGVR